MEQLKYQDFTYTKDYKDESQSIRIEHPKEKPEHIHKYYGISSYSVDALINGYFYASHPFELNDILDSSYFLFHTSKALGFEYYDKLLGFLYEDKRKLVEFYEKDISNSCHGYIYNFWQTFTNILGIISTSESEGSALMWPHYTQEKGFQLKFNTALLEQSISENLTKNEEYLGLLPMNYTESLNPIDISNYKQMFIPLYYATTIKLDKWNYENEWRFLIGKQQMGVPYSKIGFNPQEDYLVDKANRFTYYDRSIVKGITIGKNFFNGAEFELVRMNHEVTKVKPREVDSNWQFESQKALLNYICSELKDKFYCSGVKYEFDEEKGLHLIRTKERMLIEPSEDGFYLLTRTNEVTNLKP